MNNMLENTEISGVSNILKKIKKLKVDTPYSVAQFAQNDDKVRVYRDWETDRKSTRLNSSHRSLSRMPSSA